MSEENQDAVRTYLKQVQLKGYKSIKEVDVELHKGLNIVIGKNAAGKTSFLEFLDDILNEDYQKFVDFDSKLIFQDEDTFEKKIWRDISLESFKIEEGLPEVNKEFNVLEEVVPSFRVEDEKAIYTLKGISYNSNLVKYGIPTDCDLLTKPYSIEDRGNMGWMSLGLSGRRKSSFIYALKRSLSNEIFEVFINKKSNTKTTWEKLISAFEQKLKHLKPHLAKVTPIQDIRLYSDYQIYTSNSEWSLKNLILEFMVNGEWYPFDDLSDGTKRLFYIISEIIGLGNDSGNQITLLEEPELGIHPHQLHDLMTFIKEQSKEKQIIITTHSPKVLDALKKDELDQIIIATYEGEKGTQLKHLTQKQIEKAQNYMEDMYLSDYWLYSDLED